MAFRTRPDLQNQAIGWLRKGYNSVGGGTVVQFPLSWTSSGECRLTHPDEDHLRGFDDLFHAGLPTKWSYDADDDDRKILVDEIWCSSYAANPNDTTDVSKPLLNEIKRRKKLKGSDEGEENGNRLEILCADDEIQITRSFKSNVLAPNDNEVDIGTKKLMANGHRPIRPLLSLIGV